MDLENGTINEITTKEKIDEVNSNQDFFIEHFNIYMGQELSDIIKNPSCWTTEFHQSNALGRVIFELPQLSESLKPNLLLPDYSENGMSSSRINFPSQIDLSQLSLRPEIFDKINANKLTSKQKELLNLMCQYVDIYFPEATFNQWENIKLIYSIHCINHVIKTRKQIIENNETLSSTSVDSISHKDQGFTRPKVLILLPFKHSAYRVIMQIMSLVSGNITNKKKFKREFGPQPKDKGSVKKSEKPMDFQQTFLGDINEDFIIGLTVTKKSLRLYSEIYDSDIIIGSPLGVRYTIETSSSCKETDFLSSIEILVLDQADIFQMQNWEHILIIMEALNQPLTDISKLHSDVMRVRLWCLEGFSNIFRQTLVFGSTVTDLNRTLVTQGQNYVGKIQVLNFVNEGSVSDILVQSELILQRVNNADNSFCPDSQFAYFTQHILPQLRLSPHSHMLLYIPDYCDYIRIVKHMKEDGGTSIATINEYMVEEPNKIAKAKSLFFDGKRQILIYTERMHFYKRFKIKGIQHILFYGLPTYPHFFSELCNLMSTEYQNRRGTPLFGLNTITALYQPIEATKLVGILGTQKAAAIIRSDKNVHMCTIGATSK